MVSKLESIALLRFSLENYRSFRDVAELTCVATSRRDEPSHVISSPHTDYGVLPAIGIWGANASGKSNLLRAIQFLRGAVLNSHSQWRPTDPVPNSPWRLREGQGPTRLELEFLLGEVRYLFGFSINEGAFVEEKLFRWDGARRQVLYYRDASAEEQWYFGPGLRGQRARIAKATRSNSLFLSAAAQENHDELLPVYRAIIQGIRPARPVALQGFPTFEAGHPFLQEESRARLVELLGAADIGVSDIQVKRHDISFPDELKKIFTEEAYAQIQAPDRELRELHLTRGGDDPWTLPPQEESAGTSILLARFSDAIEVLREGGIWIVDELDSSLHPDLCVELVALFTNPESNTAGAQILFSTHDRDILGALRTDEVYLVSKGYDCSSSLAAASDYRGVRARDNLRRVHSEGRLRGVPVLGDFARIVAQGG